MGYMIGNYEILEKLGSGGMGEVFKGRDTKTNQLVAIKILDEEISKNPRQVERFKREIRQVLQLSHPNLVTGITCGEFKDRLFYMKNRQNTVVNSVHSLRNYSFFDVRSNLHRVKS